MINVADLKWPCSEGTQYWYRPDRINKGQVRQKVSLLKKYVQGEGKGNISEVESIYNKLWAVRGLKKLIHDAQKWACSTSGSIVSIFLGPYGQLTMADCKYCNLYFCSITCLNKKRYSLELNATTPICKCVLTKLGMLVAQWHCIWLL